MDHEQYYKLMGDMDNLIVNLVLESELDIAMKIALRTDPRAGAEHMIAYIAGCDTYITTA